ncbi:MAG TPA: PTS sugar transporter subunit IIB [Symbiobacteriaceae bacterium]
MPIVMVRSDDRLIHGLVVTHWMGHMRFNRAVVVDEVTARSPGLTSVLKFAAPPGLKVTVLTEAEAVEKLTNGTFDKDRVIVIAKSPAVFQRLREAGWKGFSELNLGPSSYKPGAINVGPNTALLPEEVKACEQLVADGVRVYVQLIPPETPVEWANAIRKATGQK